MARRGLAVGIGVRRACWSIASLPRRALVPGLILPIDVKG